MRRAGAVVAVGVVASALLACGSQAPVFVDATEAAGLDHLHTNGRTGELFFNEILGPGVALFDYDRDGDLDLYLGQGSPLGPGGQPEAGGAGDRLFRNDALEQGRGGSSVRFVDVTGASGLHAFGYSMGVAVGDYDDDGWLDLYVTNHGPNQLWRNNGDGTFSDVTGRAGADDPRWSTSATFLDYDADGHLDLFVVNYVRYTAATQKTCLTTSGVPDYCGPQSFEPEPDRLLRNRGDGTFEEVTGQANLLTEPGSGLGVVAADFDEDGRTDLYVANDLMRNHLWRNQGDGTFRNEALLAGVAVNGSGAAEASMGVEAGDVDNDGDLDLFMTHLTGETNTLYRNQGGAMFLDASAPSLLGAPSLEYTGFGVAMLDVDNDGWLDVYTANGAVKQIPRQREAGEDYPLRQRNQLFRNLGDGTFAEWGSSAGELGGVEVSRGVAVGDVDNDGDPDLLVANNSGPARLLLDRSDPRSAWTGVDLRRHSGRPAIGWRVTLERASGPAVARWVRSDGSFCSSRDPRVLLGAGSAPEVPRIRLAPPGRRDVVWARPPLRRYLVSRVGDA